MMHADFIVHRRPCHLAMQTRLLAVRWAGPDGRISFCR